MFGNGKQVFHGMIGKHPVFRGRNTQIRPALPHIAYYPGQTRGTNNTFIRKWKGFPVYTIKCQNSFTIGKVKDTLLVLSYLTVLCASLIKLLGIIDNIRKPDRILAKSLRKKNNQK